MRLRLKEDPREWRRFAWALSGAVALVAALLAYRAPDPSAPAFFGFALAVAVFVTGSLWPRAYRPVYRAAMRFSHAMGQVVGRVLLGLLFVLLLLPLGLILRLSGKDLLQLKTHRGRQVDSYWQPVKPPGPLDRLF
jgi:uncharacterized membrane protein